LALGALGNKEVPEKAPPHLQQLVESSMKSLHYVYIRTHSLWKARGTKGFLKFILSRLARITKDIVFEIDLKTQDREKNTLPSVGTLIVVDKEDLEQPWSKQTLQNILKGENEIYSEGLKHDDILLAVEGSDQETLHYSFVQFISRYKKVIGENNQTPMFVNCWTAPEARGRRLYPTVLSKGCEILGKKGYEKALITCHPDNIASIKGIEHAGFGKKRNITSLILLSRIVIQKREGMQLPRILSLF
jgi:hypothetical protein